MVSNYKLWMDRAISSLKLASVKKEEGIYYEDLCFQAQQAVEKALKALLIKKGQEPERTHNLIVLLQKVMQFYRVPEDVKDLIILNDYAVQTRYPGDYTPIDEEEYREAIRIATKTIEWARKLI